MKLLTERSERIRLLERSIIEKWIELLERADKLEELGESAHATRMRAVVLDCMRDVCLVLKG